MNWFNFSNVSTFINGTFNQYALQKLINQLSQGQFLGYIPNVVLAGVSLGTGISVKATITNGICTVTHTAHGYSVNDGIVLTGTSGTGTFGALYQITSVTANTYTFFTPASGTVTSPVEMFWFKGSRSINTNLISNVTRPALGNYTFTFTNTQPDKYYGLQTWGESSSYIFIAGSSNVYPRSTTSFTVIFLVYDADTSQDATEGLYVALTGIQ